VRSAPRRFASERLSKLVLRVLEHALLPGVEARKPKKAKVKTIAANPSQKVGQRELENLKND
jgi:hypothetical protein